MENQLIILSESLDKKLEVLQKIQDYNKRQEEIFSAENVDMTCSMMLWRKSSA